MENRNNNTSFLSQKSIDSYVMEINAPASKVFPLLCPVLEYDWLDGWECDMVHSVSGVAEYLCIFKTNKGMFGEETWVCTRHDLNKEIQYTRFSTNTVVVMDIEVIKSQENASSWKWTYSTISQNEAGNKIIEAFQQGLQANILKYIEASLIHYIQTGKKLIK